MKTIDVAAIVEDPLARWRFLEEFVSFGPDDRAALSESLAVLGPRLPRILDSVYEHLLSFDDTRRIFLGASGAQGTQEIDARYVTTRKEHLTEWLLRVAATRTEESIVPYVVKVARAHVGVDGEPGRQVPPRYLVGMTAHLQTIFTTALFDELPDRPRDALRMALAWNKLLVIQLETFLKVSAPLWPLWDSGARA
jgi:hypothetical protein